ncbi:MAG TPA: patatin-like phospholipase family protein [Hyphomicrobiaceae bacterium]|nr:patatin-like phospholipase family protein [Hyphomicrobiaceae bacterium]
MQERAGTASSQDPKAASTVKSVTLALQGGGAHGAFGWGVLDELLSDPRIGIEAISATSAGAMNAVVLAYGISIGGREGARAKLTEFWKAISDSGRLYSPVRTLPWERWLQSAGVKSEFSPSFMLFQAATHLFSPYQINPFNFNPLRHVLERVVDFRHLAQCPIATRLYLCATNVRTGKIRVFENAELSAAVVLASACLPYVFQAVEIDGEHYWDGGFVGNPAIFPLIYRQGSRDVILVHINPLERAKLPTTAPEIFDRMNELSFNSSLMREMRAIAFVTRLIDIGALDNSKYARMLIHSIRDDQAMCELGVATKLNPDWEFLQRLRDSGRNSARRWIEGHYGSIGQDSTIDVAGVFL